MPESLRGCAISQPSFRNRRLCGDIRDDGPPHPCGNDAPSGQPPRPRTSLSLLSCPTHTARRGTLQRAPACGVRSSDWIYSCHGNFNRSRSAPTPYEFDPTPCRECQRFSGPRLAHVATLTARRLMALMIESRLPSPCCFAPTRINWRRCSHQDSNWATSPSHRFSPATDVARMAVRVCYIYRLADPARRVNDICALFCQSPRYTTANAMFSSCAGYKNDLPVKVVHA